MPKQERDELDNDESDNNNSNHRKRIRLSSTYSTTEEDIATYDDSIVDTSCIEDLKAREVAEHYNKIITNPEERVQSALFRFRGYYIYIFIYDILCV